MVLTQYSGRRKPKSGKVITYDWEDFCRFISHPAGKYAITYKEFNNLPDDFDDWYNHEWYESQFGIKDRYGGAVYGTMKTIDGESGRKKDNFPTRSALSFDYENCDESIFDRIKTALADYSYAYYTTTSHRPPDNRVRVIVPFAKEIDWKYFCLLTVLFARKIGVEGLDKTCCQPYRMMLYSMQIKEDETHWKEFKSGHQTKEFLDGEDYLMKHYNTLDVKEISKQADIHWKDEKWKMPEMEKMCKEVKILSTTKIAGKKIVVTNVYDFRPKKAQIGDVKSCFNAVFDVTEILDLLPDYIRESDLRYTYRLGSSTGGIQVSEDKTFCFCHQESGPLANGHKWSAFDLYLLYIDRINRFREGVSLAHKYASEKKGERYGKLYYGLFRRK